MKGTHGTCSSNANSIRTNGFRYSNVGHCSVIFTHLNVENQDILDFEDQQVREKFVVYSQKVYERIKGKSKEEKISTTYDLFVSEVEKTIGKTFSMIHVKVQAPQT